MIALMVILLLLVALSAASALGLTADSRDHRFDMSGMVGEKPHPSNR